MKSLGWLVVAGFVAAPFVGCGPDDKPPATCEGPSINLLLRAENGPLPAGTHINVRYGGNREGEPYTLGDTRSGQAVFCSEDTSPGGAAGEAGPALSAGAGGAPTAPSDDAVWALRCSLYTQGPARLDAEADGYEPFADEELSLEEDLRCRVPIEKVLRRMVDAGAD